MNPQDLARLTALLEAAPWTFAKTMPHNPHHYTLRDKWEDADFVWAVEQIRAHGYREMFKGRPYTLFTIGEFKYWTMGNPLPETTLINRKTLDADKP